MRHLPRRTSTGAPLLIRRAAVVGASLAATLALAAPASAATSVQIDDGTLQITGDSANNKIALFNQAASIAIDLGADGTAEFTADRTAFTKVEVKGGNGDDELTVANAGGALDLPITLDGGNGNDSLRGAAGAETLIGGSGDDFADGNIGADTAKLGSGNDRFQWDPGDGSDTVEGESGTDALDFNGSNIGELIDVTANGSRVRLTRNVASIAMDLDALESIKVRALGGADEISVGDLTGTGLRVTDVDLRAFDGAGDAADDKVIARGTDAADRFNVVPAGGKVRLDGPASDVEVTSAEAQDHARVAGARRGRHDHQRLARARPRPGGHRRRRRRRPRDHQGHRRRRRDRHRPQRHRRRRDVRHRLRRGQPRRGRVASPCRASAAPTRSSARTASAR